MVLRGTVAEVEQKFDEQNFRVVRDANFLKKCLSTLQIAKLVFTHPDFDIEFWILVSKVILQKSKMGFFNPFRISFRDPKI